LNPAIRYFAELQIVPDRVFAILQIVFTPPAVVQKQTGIIIGFFKTAADNLLTPTMFIPTGGFLFCINAKIAASHYENNVSAIVQHTDITSLYPAVYVLARVVLYTV